MHAWYWDVLLGAACFTAGVRWLHWRQRQTAAEYVDRLQQELKGVPEEQRAEVTSEVLREALHRKVW